MQEENYPYFLEADFGSYIGEWITIGDNKVIAHDRKLKEVVKEAKYLTHDKKFLLVKIHRELFI